MAKKTIRKSTKKPVKASSVEAFRKNFEKEVAKGMKSVEKEAAKMKKSVDTAVKQADAYIRKNPEKAMAIASGISAALGAAAALIATHGKKGKK
ncbi:MAG: hypothetical protein HGA38_00315 [Candidatus Moranbacteria bacterium]|nr:hypothetical protein [Candidatus Moranbacteria bacterium]NTW45979.1 hypothetical protein [Candidatus Moranbacteria bacterium]